MKEMVFTNGKKITLTIHALASSGSGVGLIQEEGYNKPVFVRYTVPGDKIVAQLTRKYKKYYEGRLCEILVPSSDRITPCCQHFGVCGACDFLHISYQQQIESKLKLLTQILHKSLLTIPPITVIFAQEPLHYRTKTKVFSRQGIVGFSARKENKIIPITHCGIIKEELNAIFTKSALSDGEHIFAYDEQTNDITTNKDCFYTVEECTLAFHPYSFVQSNSSMNKELVRIVCALIPTGTVLDLYAGNGNFSVPLAKKGCEVVAVEGDINGYHLLNDNATHNKVSIAPYHYDVRDFLLKKSITQKSIILDPPRTGAYDILPYLGTTAQTIVYVSCNAQELGKELSYLCGRGYGISSIRLIDLFPQTRHFETVVCLHKNSQNK